MAKLDKEKEKISVLRFWLGVSVAILLIVVGYCVANYTKMDLYVLIANVFFIIFLGVFILLISTKINKKIDKLENL